MNGVSFIILPSFSCKTLSFEYNTKKIHIKNHFFLLRSTSQKKTPDIDEQKKKWCLEDPAPIDKRTESWRYGFYQTLLETNSKLPLKIPMVGVCSMEISIKLGCERPVFKRHLLLVSGHVHSYPTVIF